MADETLEHGPQDEAASAPDAAAPRTPAAEPAAPGDEAASSRTEPAAPGDAAAAGASDPTREHVLSAAELEELTAQLGLDDQAVQEGQAAGPHPDDGQAQDAETNEQAKPHDPAVIGVRTVAASADQAQAFAPPELSGDMSETVASLDMLDDVQLDVRIELGRTEMYIEDVLKLGAGSVVELDKLAGDPVDIYVNERLIARGEVLVLNDNFCVRINDIHCPIPELEEN